MFKTPTSVRLASAEISVRLRFDPTLREFAERRFSRPSKLPKFRFCPIMRS